MASLNCCSAWHRDSLLRLSTLICSTCRAHIHTRTHTDRKHMSPAEFVRSSGMLRLLYRELALTDGKITLVLGSGIQYQSGFCDSWFNMGVVFTACVTFIFSFELTCKQDYSWQHCNITYSLKHLEEIHTRAPDVLSRDWPQRLRAMQRAHPQTPIGLWHGPVRLKASLPSRTAHAQCGAGIPPPFH